MPAQQCNIQLTKYTIQLNDSYSFPEPVTRNYYKAKWRAVVHVALHLNVPRGIPGGHRF